MGRKRPTMLIPELAQKRMFLLVLFVFLISVYFDTIHTHLHSKLAWYFDIRYLAMILNNISWGVFLITYLLFALLKKDTHKKWSLIHLVILMSIFMINQVIGGNNLELLLVILSIIIFIINISKSLIKKN